MSVSYAITSTNLKHFSVKGQLGLSFRNYMKTFVSRGTSFIAQQSIIDYLYNFLAEYFCKIFIKHFVSLFVHMILRPNILGL